MASLALSRNLIDRYARLDHAVRKRVQDLAEKCRRKTLAELSHTGLRLEPYNNQRDPRARTIRLGDNHRGIVLVPDGTEQIVLVDVLTHDAADRWMLDNEFRVNEATGALEIVDLAAIHLAADEAAGDASAADAHTDTGPTTSLFEHRRDKDFTQLGISADLVGVIRLIQSEDQLMGLLEVLPQGQADALIMLTGTDSVETIYAAVAGEERSTEIDPDDLAAAVEAPASRGEFHVVSDDAELADMLAKPFATWRTYLHPSQHDAAYKMTYNGPARVTGGAGTGKTVVAVHRAQALADALEDRSGKPILFTTFTRNLAQAIERDLFTLGGNDLLAVVEVLNVDRLAHRVVSEVEGRQPSIISGRDLVDLIEVHCLEVGSERPATFIAQEWEQVVLAQGIESRADYFAANRSGRGTRLNRLARAEVWKVIESFTRELSARNRRTYLQVAAAAAGYLRADPVKPYRHVIVDEAQDIHETQWRLLRAAVEPAPNDMFIVGDSHQRIYDRRSSLSKVGIEIRGRSRKLRINYRTTHEILRWSMGLLGEGDFDDLDEGTETHDTAGYHSFMHGPAPTLVGTGSTAEMIDALVPQVREWIRDGIAETDIAVAARTVGELRPIESALRAAGVATQPLGRDLTAPDGVALATMHRMKGLEYRAVAVIGVADDHVPFPPELTPANTDPVQHEADLQRERCLVYVACTRAREDLWIGWSGTPSRFIPP